MELFLYRFLFVLLYIVLTAVLLTTAIGLPGNWILVGIAVVISAIGKFTGALGWEYLLVIVGLATLGELIESLLGAVVVVKRGGTKWGVIGSILGGFAGVILGAGVMPPLGSVLFGFVGAFAGAVLGEWAKQQQVEPALRVGFWSFVGRALAIAAKVAVGFVILVLIVIQTWP